MRCVSRSQNAFANNAPPYLLARFGGRKGAEGKKKEKGGERERPQECHQDKFLATPMDLFSSKPKTARFSAFCHEQLKLCKQQRSKR